MRLSLHWKWFAILAAFLTVLLVVANIAIDLSLRPFLNTNIRQNLQREVLLAQAAFLPKLAAPVVAEINDMAHRLSETTGLRVTIMSPTGVVLGESNKPPQELDRIENHLQRPEVQDALRSPFGVATRRSDTVDVDLLYLASAARGAVGELFGFVRVALPLDEIARTTQRVQTTVALASVTVGLLAVPFLFWMARRTTTPIMQMREVAGRVARGDFSRRVPVGGGEVGELAGALNVMSAQLEGRLRELSQEKADLAGVLASMTEGVLVLDGGGKIRLVNDSLQNQFQMGKEAIGKTVMEAFRNVALDELLAEARRGGEIEAREMTLLLPAERVLEVNASALRSADGATMGVVAVFHDIVRLKRLENMRKEFVANVSHELRTPLSIIKGYIETLLEPEAPDAETAKGFLRIIQRHSRRLEALLGDLLTISALESQQARLTFEPVALRSLAEAVAEELATRAKERSLTVSNEIDPTLRQVRADSLRLHQVFFNLLDNAVKYTQPEGRVTVSARQIDGAVEVCVTDTGPGISAEHLPHIFERFYRVDKARSREMGGTGLGLAIVKHIVLAHGGRVWAESQIDKGSRFYFTLPVA